MDLDVEAITNLIQNLGLWAIFTWLYIQEKKAHDLTREKYVNDLREIAGMRQNLAMTQVYTKDAKTVPSSSEMVIS